jgi:hypothetical protein
MRTMNRLIGRCVLHHGSRRASYPWHASSSAHTASRRSRRAGGRVRCERTTRVQFTVLATGEHRSDRLSAPSRDPSQDSLRASRFAPLV